MSNIDTQSNDQKFKKQPSDTIQGELIDLYCPNGYKPIMQAKTKICGKKNKKSLQILQFLQKCQKEFLGDWQVPKF